MSIRLSDAMVEDKTEPVALNNIRLSDAINPNNITNATIDFNESVNTQKKRGMWEQTAFFLGEAIAKPIGRAIKRVPTVGTNLWNVGVDNLRIDYRNKLKDAGVRFGISEEEFKARSPEKQKEVESYNKILTRLNRSEEISTRLSDNFNKLAEEGLTKRDPSVWQGKFMENPSWTRAIALGMESAPYLGIAAAVTAATKSPVMGASIIGGIQGLEEKEQAKKAGASLEEANIIGISNAVVNSVLETIPLTTFLKGGSIPLKAFESGIGRNIGNAITIAGQEATEEALQGIWTNAVAQIGYDKTRKLTEGLIESIVAGGLSGGVIGSFSSARAQELDTIIDEAKEAGVDVDTITEVVGNMVVNNGDAISEKILDNSTKINIPGEPLKAGEEIKVGEGITIGEQGGKAETAQVPQAEQAVLETTQGVPSAEESRTETITPSKEQGIVKEEPASVRVRDDAEAGVVKGKNVTKKRKVKSLIKEVQLAGGIDIDKAKEAGFTYEDFKQFGLLNILKKGGRGVDDLASELQSTGVINVPQGQNATEYLINTLKYNRDILTKVAEKNDSEYDIEYEKWLKENKNENEIEPIPAEAIRELEANIEKEINIEEDQGDDWAGMREFGLEPIQEPDVPVVVKEAEVKPEPTVVKVSPDILPVGEGKRKVSRLAARMQRLLNETNPEKIKDLPGFNTLNNKETIQKAAEYVVNNPEEAMEVLHGIRSAPEGLNWGAVYVAMEQNSIGDPNMVRTVASLRATRLGQEISILQELDPNSAVRYIINLQNLKLEAYSQDKDVAKEKVKKRIVDETAKIQKAAEREKKKAENWAKFIDEIEC